VLVVDYILNQPLSVHLSRKRNFTADVPDAKEIVVDPEVEHGKYFNDHLTFRKGRMNAIY